MGIESRTCQHSNDCDLRPFGKLAVDEQDRSPVIDQLYHFQPEPTVILPSPQAMRLNNCFIDTVTASLRATVLRDVTNI
jgi:hypothetical protein